MIYISKLIRSSAIIAAFSACFMLVSPVLAGPFDSSAEQACKGAALDSGISEGECAEKETAAQKEVSDTIQQIVDLLTIIVGIIAVFLIIINGLRFITSNGDSNAVGSAKNGIIYAIVGLIIVAFAQVIVRFVLERTG
jgi:hypothetical protein